MRSFMVCIPHQIKENEAYAGEQTNAYRVLVRKSEQKRQLRIYRYKWENNVKN
jgi:hypothetical protein